MITGFKPVDPRGGMTADPRVIIATTTPSGNAICESKRPAALASLPSVYSTISASTSCSDEISRVAAGVAGGFSVSPSLRATSGA